MAGLSLRSRIGVTSVNHVAVLVRRGMLNGAVSFFVDQLRWREEKEDMIQAEWGTARFVHDSTGVRIQLTELNDVSSEPTTIPGFHLGISVRDAAQAAKMTVEWSRYAGVTGTAEKANEEGTKWFVTIDKLFTFDIEFVTFSPDLG